MCTHMRSPLTHLYNTDTCARFHCLLHTDTVSHIHTYRLRHTLFLSHTLIFSLLLLAPNFDGFSLACRTTQATALKRKSVVCHSPYCSRLLAFPAAWPEEVSIAKKPGQNPAVAIGLESVGHQMREHPPSQGHSKSDHPEKG